MIRVKVEMSVDEFQEIMRVREKSFTELAKEIEGGIAIVFHPQEISIRMKISA